MKAEDLELGQWVVYRPHPDAPGEDGEVVTIVRDELGGVTVVRVKYLNGPQAGKVCATSPADLQPGITR